jgi:hypothetical protein
MHPNDIITNSKRQKSESATTSTTAALPKVVINHGKLPRSGYFDLPSDAQNSTTAVTGMNTNNQPNNEQIIPEQPNENLEVWATGFSPDNSHLAWSCGHGIIKIMKWEKSCYSKQPPTCCENGLHDDEDAAGAKRLHVDYKVFNNYQTIGSGLCSDESTTGVHSSPASTSRTFNYSNKLQVCRNFIFSHHKSFGSEFHRSRGKTKNPRKTNKNEFLFIFSITSFCSYFPTMKLTKLTKNSKSVRNKQIQTKTKKWGKPNKKYGKLNKNL